MAILSIEALSSSLAFSSIGNVSAMSLKVSFSFCLLFTAISYLVMLPTINSGKIYCVRNSDCYNWFHWNYRYITHVTRAFVDNRQNDELVPSLPFP